MFLLRRALSVLFAASVVIAGTLLLLPRFLDLTARKNSLLTHINRESSGTFRAGKVRFYFIPRLEMSIQPIEFIEKTASSNRTALFRAQRALLRPALETLLRPPRSLSLHTEKAVVSINEWSTWRQTLPAKALPISVSKGSERASIFESVSLDAVFMKNPTVVFVSAGKTVLSWRFRRLDLQRDTDGWRINGETEAGQISPVGALLRKVERLPEMIPETISLSAAHDGIDVLSWHVGSGGRAWSGRVEWDSRLILRSGHNTVQGRFLGPLRHESGKDP